MVDLGCGLRKKEGALGVDIARVTGVDILADVFRPLPFRDNSVDEVYASHLVEHVEDLSAFMTEVWRVCKHGALVNFRFPHGSSVYGTWVDPTHRRGVFLRTFEYFDPATFAGKAFGYYQPAKFRIVKRRLSFNLNADDPEMRRRRRVAGRVFDALANRGERWMYYAERYWGPLVGIEEAYIWMRAVKPRGTAPEPKH